MPKGEHASVVVTGLSGAGKTTALNALADIGFYCVDNLPPSLAAATIRTCNDAGVERVALGMDVRVGGFLETLLEAIDALRFHAGGPQKGEETGLRVLYLDASDDVIVRRFGETRRPHPILSSLPDDQRSATMLEAVRIERARLAPIRLRATLLLDTSHLSIHQLRRSVVERFTISGEPAMLLRIVSFGFKHGLPLDANLVFDVRFLDNPHFVSGLREQTGESPAVRDFVLSSDGAEEVLEHMEKFVTWSVPRYRREGKTYLTVAVGCTGGRHRSVAIASELARRVSSRTGERIGIVHRDVQRGGIMTAVSISPESLGEPGAQEDDA